MVSKQDGMVLPAAAQGVQTSHSGDDRMSSSGLQRWIRQLEGRVDPAEEDMVLPTPRKGVHVEVAERTELRNADPTMDVGAAACLRQEDLQGWLAAASFYGRAAAPASCKACTQGADDGIGAEMVIEDHGDGRPTIRVSSRSQLAPAQCQKCCFGSR
mmetsp:Transcript_43859/g.121901  ORF Transcript_43859/g.121901 Transcript_43859/m.121901 type:complete len:157 (+) Transcript_43859:1265-1735(+)